jgi:hypothetical protein
MDARDVELLKEIAYVFGMGVSTLVSLEAMKAANAERERKGLSPAYGEDEFTELQERNGMYHNALVSTLVTK